METPKSLLKHLGAVMTKLDQGKIDVETAKAHASLVKQSNNIMRYELDVLKFNEKRGQK